MCYGIFHVTYKPSGVKHDTQVIKCETKADFEAKDLELQDKDQIESFSGYIHAFKRTRIARWDTSHHVEPEPES